MKPLVHHCSTQQHVEYQRMKGSSEKSSHAPSNPLAPARRGLGDYLLGLPGNCAPSCMMRYRSLGL